MAAQKLGVVLLNMGGPDSTADVPAYLLNIFHDPAILDMPLGFLVRPWLSRLIVRKRAAASAGRYEQIGGKTPLNEIARQQAAAIQHALGERGLPAIALPGMRYWHPFIEEAVRRFKDGGVTRVVALSMYPHYSAATTGSCMRELRRAMNRHLPGVPSATIDRWPGLPHYVDFLADNTARTLESLPRESRPRTAVLFSAHGVPVRLIEKGDPYRDQVEETCRLVCAKLPRDTRTALGWQSAFGPAKWLEPDSKTLAARFAKDGVENLIVVPLGFAAENIETLWDIEIDLKSFAVEQGIHRFLRMPCPNVELGVMCGLAALVGEAAEGKES